MPAIPAMPQLISANNFAARHGRQVRPHDQRRFHHADEDVRRRADAERPADAERAPQHEGKGGDDLLHQAKIE